MQIKKLGVRHNEQMKEEGIRAIAAITKNCEVQELSMDCCDLESREMNAFLDGIGDCKVSNVRTV